MSRPDNVFGDTGRRARRLLSVGYPGCCERLYSRSADERASFNRVIMAAQWESFR
jgi:hypothetical protein